MLEVIISDPFSVSASSSADNFRQISERESIQAFQMSHCTISL